MFALQQRVRAHPRGARAICVFGDGFLTGGYSGEVIHWEAAEGGSLLTKKREFHLHGSSTVMALCGDASGGTFFSGGRDGLVKETSVSSGEILRTIGETPGRKALPISSLALCQGHLLIGDWSGVCRVLRLTDGHVVASLGRHQHAVTVTAYVRPTDGELAIVTGCQTGNINFWTLQHPTAPHKTLTKFHRDIVRQLAVDETKNLLYSCSNDGCVGVIDLTSYAGNKRTLSDTFIYGICLGDSWLATCTEDRTLASYDTETWKPIARRELTATVWGAAVAQAPATACVVAVDESGDVSLWRIGDDGDQFEQETLAAEVESQRAVKKEDAIDMSTLPHVSQLNSIRGTKPGQHKLFKSDFVVEVYQWNGSAWDKVGDMLSDAPAADKAAPAPSAGPSGPGGFFPGDSYFPAGNYDWIFPVALGDSNETTQLPLNRTDNLLLVAEKFCARQGLNKAMYLQEICTWVKQQTGGALDQQSAPPPPPPAPAATASTSSSAEDAQLISAPMLFEGGNFELILRRLKECNARTAEENKLTALELQYLEELMAKCGSPLFKQRPLKKCELTLVFDTEKIEHWEPEGLLPWLDLRRALAVHSDMIEIHKGTDAGWRLVKFALELLRGPCSTKAEAGAAECGAKYLANVLTHPTCANGLALYQHELLRLLSVNTQGPRAVQTSRAVAAIAVNLSLSAKRRNRRNEAELLLKWIVEQVPHEVGDDETLCLLLSAAGTAAALLGAEGRVITSSLTESIQRRSIRVMQVADKIRQNI